MGKTKGPIGPKVRDMLAGNDVEVGSIQEADELLEQALPYATKVTGSGRRHRPVYADLKAKNVFGIFHKDYVINPDTRLIYGYDMGSRHAGFRHINVKLPITGVKVTIIIRPE